MNKKPLVILFLKTSCIPIKQITNIYNLTISGKAKFFPFKRYCYTSN